MANIKLELDEYLNKSQKNKPSNGHHVHIPKVFKKLLANEPGEQTETLLDSAQKTYFNFPSLVRYIGIYISFSNGLSVFVNFYFNHFI